MQANEVPYSTNFLMSHLDCLLAFLPSGIRTRVAGTKHNEGTTKPPPRSKFKEKFQKLGKWRRQYKFPELLFLLKLGQVNPNQKQISDWTTP